MPHMKSSHYYLQSSLVHWFWLQAPQLLIFSTQRSWIFDYSILFSLSLVPQRLSFNLYQLIKSLFLSKGNLWKIFHFASTVTPQNEPFWRLISTSSPYLLLMCKLFFEQNLNYHLYLAFIKDSQQQHHYLKWISSPRGKNRSLLILTNSVLSREDFLIHMFHANIAQVYSFHMNFHILHLYCSFYQLCTYSRENCYPIIWFYPLKFYK